MGWLTQGTHTPPPLGGVEQIAPAAGPPATTEAGRVIWTTLEHSGPAFPAPYAVHGIPITYGARSLVLTAEQEEAATLFAELLRRGEPACTDAVFRANFFASWRALLQQTAEGAMVHDLDKCDLSPLVEGLRSGRARLPAARSAAGVRVLVDGRTEVIPAQDAGVPGPSIFMGRGDHPKRGTFVPRVHAEDVVLNLGADAPLPPAGNDGRAAEAREAPQPRHWAGVVHRPTAQWIARWTEPIAGVHKFVWLPRAAAAAAAPSAPPRAA